MKVIRNDLNSFLKKLKKVQKLKSELAVNIAEKGQSIAKTRYAASGINPKITIESNAPAKASIVFEHEAIAFHEFGTGAYAVYPDNSKLPKSGVPITGSWQYYYPSPYKVSKDGKDGWFYGGTFTIGTPSNAEIYYTAQELKQNIIPIVKSITRTKK